MVVTNDSASAVRVLELVWCRSTKLTNCSASKKPSIVDQLGPRTFASWVQSLRHNLDATVDQASNSSSDVMRTEIQLLL